MLIRFLGETEKLEKEREALPKLIVAIGAWMKV
jgi:hypothetical protein